MNELHNYLNRYFPNGPTSGEYEGEKNVDIVPHFFDKFGVDVKNTGNLYLFKYDMLAVKFGVGKIPHLCRGHIYQFKNNKWKLVCNAMSKFFNFDESHNPLFQEEDFKTYINQIELKTKEDGSLIHIYNVNDSDENSVDDGWRLSTSGTIDPSNNNIGDFGLTFTDLFWQTAKLSKSEFLSKLDKANTYIFELCTKTNMIVTQYASDRIYLLNIRNTEYGTYQPIDELAKQLNVLIPKSIFLYELGIKTKEELSVWVENNCVDSDDSKFKEGYVGYINNVPSVKIKSAKYKFLHKFKGNNNLETRNNLIEAYFTSNLDDVYGSLNDASLLFVESLRLKVINDMTAVNTCVESMKNKSFANQKEYALYVLANAPKMYSSFFFQNKEKILSGVDMKEMFSKYLQVNYIKFQDHWKN